jgi:hypothetical protein
MKERKSDWGAFTLEDTVPSNLVCDCKSQVPAGSIQLVEIYLGMSKNSRNQQLLGCGFVVKIVEYLSLDILN